MHKNRKAKHILLMLTVLLIVGLATAKSHQPVEATVCYYDNWKTATIRPNGQVYLPGGINTFHPGPGTHYVEFYNPSLGSLKRITPQWREPNGRGWQSWGPFYAFSGRTIRITLRTGNWDVHYQFIVKNIGRTGIFNIRYRFISC